MLSAALGITEQEKNKNSYIYPLTQNDLRINIVIVRVDNYVNEDKNEQNETYGTLSFWT